MSLNVRLHHLHKGSLSFSIPFMYLGRNQARGTAHMLVVWLPARDHILCSTGKAKEPSCKILLVSWYHLLRELSTIPACLAGGMGRIKHWHPEYLAKNDYAKFFHMKFYYSHRLDHWLIQHTFWKSMILIGKIKERKYLIESNMSIVFCLHSRQRKGRWSWISAA